MCVKKVYLNGCILPAEDAGISVADAGLLHGASVFTTMLARNGVVFRLDRHIDRLMSTLAMFEMLSDASGDELRGGVTKLLDANGLSDARVRITLTPGEAGRDRPTTLITADPLPEYPRKWYDSGLLVVVSTFKQWAGDPTCGVKTGCYFPRVLAMREAAAKGADEALWYTADNRLAEACFCSVFLVSQAVVRTAPLKTPVLPGIVREAVTEICGREGIVCDDQSALTVHDMLAADEIFLTASCSGVRPVTRVEGHTVGDGLVGPITKRIMAAHHRLLDSECPPAG